MPGIARGDNVDTVSTNHGCDPTTTCEGNSGSVFVEGIGVHRRGDATALHTILVGVSCVPHTAPIAVGSTSVFANGKGIARKGDAYIGTEAVKTGSFRVFAGG